MAFPEGFLRTPTFPQAYSNIMNLQMRQLDGTVTQYRAEMGPEGTIIADVNSVSYDDSVCDSYVAGHLQRLCLATAENACY